MLGVSGYRFTVPLKNWSPRNEPPDRPDLVLPESWVERLEDAVLDQIARPLLDLVYQCFDVSSCNLYDQAGNWAPNRR